MRRNRPTLQANAPAVRPLLQVVGLELTRGALGELLQQRYWVMRGREDQAGARTHTVESTKDCRVTYGMRNRLHIELRHGFVMATAGAASAGCSTFSCLATGVNIDVCHVSLLCTRRLLCAECAMMRRDLTILNYVEKNAPATTPLTASGRIFSPTRRQIFDLLQKSADALPTSEITRATGLHENTVRAQLDALHADGYIERETASSERRGRPAHLWRVDSAIDATAATELSVVLTSAMNRQSGDPAHDARAAGQEWGRTRPAGADPAATIMQTMRGLGFAPRREGDTTIALHNCPLSAAVRRDAAVVCAAHRGMIEGILAPPGSDVDTEVLVPFTSPSVCMVQLPVAAQSLSR